jgi:hypothetical protein
MAEETALEVVVDLLTDLEGCLRRRPPAIWGNAPPERREQWIKERIDRYQQRYVEAAAREPER